MRIGLRSAGSWAIRSSARRCPGLPQPTDPRPRRVRPRRDRSPQGRVKCLHAGGPEAAGPAAAPGRAGCRHQLRVGAMPPVLRTQRSAPREPGPTRRSRSRPSAASCSSVADRRPRHAPRGGTRAADGPARRRPRGSEQSPRTTGHSQIASTPEGAAVTHSRQCHCARLPKPRLPDSAKSPTSTSPTTFVDRSCYAVYPVVDSGGRTHRAGSAANARPRSDEGR